MACRGNTMGVASIALYLVAVALTIIASDSGTLL